MAAREGVTLDRYLRARGPLPPVQVAKVGCAIAEQVALESASARENRAPVVHPGRILARPGGGVELLAPEDDTSSSVAASFPAYTSPEEIRGGAGDFRSSLYSIGCTLFELLTGSPPFVGTNPKDVLRAHLSEPVPDPRPLVPELDDDALAETIRELLYKDPELRIQSAAELIRRLKQSAQQPLRGAAPPAAPRRAGARAPRPTTKARVRARAGTTPLATASDRGSGRQPVGGAAGKRAAGRGRGRAALQLDDGTRTSRGRSRRAPGSRGRGSAHRGAAGLRAPRVDPETGLEMDEEEYSGGPRRKKAHAFTLAGLGIGVVLGLAFAIVGLNRTRKLPMEEAQMKSELAASELNRRKELFREEMGQLSEEMENMRARASEIVASTDRPLGMKLASLEHLLRQSIGEYTVCSVPGSVAIAAEVAKIDGLMRQAGPGDGVSGAAGAASGPTGFEGYRKEFEELVAADRWGEALDKIRDAEMEYSATHSKEIDELYFGLENKLYSRWEADKKKVQELASEGEVDQALAILTKATTYGTYKIRQEAEATITTVQEQALMVTREQGSGQGPDEPQEAGFDNLEAQFEKELEEATRDESGAPSGEKEPTDGIDDSEL